MKHLIWKSNVLNEYKHAIYSLLLFLFINSAAKELGLCQRRNEYSFCHVKARQ